MIILIIAFISIYIFKKKSEVDIIRLFQKINNFFNNYQI